MPQLLVRDVPLDVVEALRERILGRVSTTEIINPESGQLMFPVNSLLEFGLADVAVLLLSFAPQALVVLVPFNVVYSAMVHANLNWTFGPLRYVFASPVFHRWHHTAQEEGMDKNFAPTFPFLDVVFGTFYMPEGRKPEHYGAPGMNVPETFVGQMIWPFKKQKQPPLIR